MRKVTHNDTKLAIQKTRFRDIFEIVWPKQKYQNKNKDDRRVCNDHRETTRTAWVPILDGRMSAI